MRNLLALISILLFTLLLRCSPPFSESAPSYEMIAIEHNEQFRMEVPSFLDTLKQINPDASLELSNSTQEVYIVVIEEKIEDLIATDSAYNLQKYFQFMSQSFAPAVFEKPLSTSINDSPALVVSAIDEENERPVVYTVALITGEKNFYQIITYTAANKKSLYGDMLEEIVYSFEEL